MKKWIALALLMSSFSVVAEDINNYRYYQTDNIFPKRENARFAVYIKSDNPCIFLKNNKDNSIEEFCQMGDSGLNLKDDYPSIYPADLRQSGASLYFIVAAPWNEQECEIFFPEKSITCESTGR